VSIINVIMNSNSCGGILKKMLIGCSQIVKVSRVPKIYNGNIAFELLCTGDSFLSLMHRMEQIYDGHS